MKKIDILLNTKNILVITWQRRLGKSYIILDYLKSKKIDLREVFYLNKELDYKNKIKTNIELENFDVIFQDDSGIKHIHIWELEKFLED